MLKFVQGIGGNIGLALLTATMLAAGKSQCLLTRNELIHQIEWGTLSKRKLRSADLTLINAPLYNGYTPLTLAITYQRPIAVRLLLEQDADPNIPDGRGITPLEAAIQSGSVPLFKQLILAGAQLTPDIAAKAAICDPFASYIYHSVRHIQIGSNKDGVNLINNINACQAQEILSAVATHADTLTELKRVVRWGAQVNYSAGDGTTIAVTSRHYCKPELIRFALTQGFLPDQLLPGELEQLLECTTCWYQHYMQNRVGAYDLLIKQLKSGNLDCDFYYDVFRGQYGLNINKLLPDYDCVDALEIATLANNYDSVVFMIANGAVNKKNALRAAQEAGHRKLYWFLWWHQH